jgi:hypothetical protein
MFYYIRKKKYTIELTEAQILWLYDIFFKMFDGYFENNRRERRHCDNVGEKIIKALESEQAD